MLGAFETFGQDESCIPLGDTFWEVDDWHGEISDMYFCTSQHDVVRIVSSPELSSSLCMSVILAKFKHQNLNNHISISISLYIFQLFFLLTLFSLPTNILKSSGVRNKKCSVPAKSKLRYIEV